MNGQVEAFKTSGSSPPALALAAASRRLRRKPGRPRAAGSLSATPAVLPRAVERGDSAGTGTAAPSLGRGRDAERGLHEPRLLTAQDAARYLGVSYWTLRSLIHAGTLRRVVLPVGDARDVRRLLVDRADLDRLVEVSKA